MVDDDQFVLRLYKDALGRQGIAVETASDGLTAIKALRANKPELVVVDLMMPAFSGVDVLKYIRAQPALAALPVVVLSNYFMNDLAQEAVAAGVQQALLKMKCSPAVLLEVVRALLEGKEPEVEPSRLLAIPKDEPAAAPRPAPEPPQNPAVTAPPSALPSALPPRNDPALRATARRELLENAPATCTELRKLIEALDRAVSPAQGDLCLQNFYRKVHFVAAAAGLAELHDLAQMASVFEALLFGLAGKPELFSPSVRQTMGRVVEFLGVLFEQAGDGESGRLQGARVLVVDDEPVANRLAVSALYSAGLHARSIQDPVMALAALGETHYDLLLLDIEMPGIDGFEFCKRARALPGYEKTPVIYVTLHSDFGTRVKGALSGGNDLIAKPVFPMELATKVVMHLLQAKPPK
jgi:CheY-like chemotaxis protein